MSEITPAQKTALLKLEGFKEIRDQYAKEQKMAGSGKKRRMKGRGFWGDVWDWFKSAGTTVNDFLKRTKLISNVAGAVLPLLAPLGTALLTANPIAAAASVGAAKAATEGIKSLGYGSKMKGGYSAQDVQYIVKGITGKGKMRGGELSNKLVINPPGQRLMGKGIFEDVLYTAAPLASLSISNAQNALSKVKKMTGKGMTFGFNGQAQQGSVPAHSGIMRNIKGGMAAQSYKLKQGNVHGMRKTMIGTGGIPYGSISSEFGNVSF